MNRLQKSVEHRSDGDSWSRAHAFASIDLPEASPGSNDNLFPQSAPPLNSLKMPVGKM
jgi:hypothetical protein